MVFLFLQNPEKDSKNTINLKEKLYLIQKIESILDSVIKTGAKQEARLWLCGTISAIQSINQCDHLKIFLNLIEKKGSKQDVAVQLVNMIFQKSPEKVGRIIAKRSSILEKFFQGNPNRILKWFDNFALTSESGHKKGSRALAQFSFSNRDSYWEELEWHGNRGKSPAVLATKPHYFQTLNVLKTVWNFLDSVPAFWSSAELADSVKDGEILQIDPDFFVNWFLGLMYEERDGDVWGLVEGFLEQERFKDISKNLVCLLDDEDVLCFLKFVRRFLNFDLEREELLNFEIFWFEILISESREFELDFFEQILGLVSVIGKPRQVLRLVCDEENQEELRNLEGILVNLVEVNNWALTDELMEMKREEAIKIIAIQSWILFYILSKECKTPKDFESVFEKNKIEFRKKKFEFEFVGSDDSDSERFDRKSRKKRKRDKKKKREKFEIEFEEEKDDQNFEFESSNGGLESKATSWYLSTDGFSTAWSIADVPEHLSMHYFTTWMKRLFFRK